MTSPPRSAAPSRPLTGSPTTTASPSAPAAPASTCPATAAPGLHPCDLPEPLRSALIGPRARGRLDRLLIIAGHASIREAARALGRWPSALYDQLGRTERACGGPLVNRSPGHRAAGSTPRSVSSCASRPATTCTRALAGPSTPPPASRARQPTGHAWLSLTLASRTGNCPSACAMARASWYSRHPATCPSRTRSTPMNGAAAPAAGSRHGPRRARTPRRSPQDERCRGPRSPCTPRTAPAAQPAPPRRTPRTRPGPRTGAACPAGQTAPR